MVRKILVSLLLIVVILTLSVGIFQAIRASRKAPPRVAGEISRLAVRIVEATRENVTEIIYGYGQVRARERTQLAPEVGGRVIWVNPELRVGHSLKEGDEILRLDPADFEKAVSRLEANVAAMAAEIEQLQVTRRGLDSTIVDAQEQLAYAQAELERLESLEGIARPSPSELDRQRNTVRVQRRILVDLTTERDLLAPRREQLKQRIRSETADLERARNDLERTRVRAPFGGSVAAEDVDLGEVLIAGTPVATLVSLSDLEVELRIPASRAPFLGVGAQARVHPESVTSEPVKGTVIRIAPEVDESTRTVACYVRLPAGQEGMIFRPGTFLRGEVPGRTFENVLALPREAFLDDLIYVMVDGRARAVKPHVSHQLAARSIVEGGVEPGDAVIVSNLESLFEGLPVVRVEESAQASPSASGD